MRRILLILVLLVAIIPNTTRSAFACEGGSNNCPLGNCGISDTCTPPPPPPPNSDDIPDAVQYPLCSSIDGVSLMNVPKGQDVKGWRQVTITCREAGGGLATIQVMMPILDGQPTPLSPGVIARSILASMQLQPISIGMAPPARSYVGIPVWMWADDPGRLDYGPATITAGGVSLTAKVTKVVWSMGDGASVTCQQGTAWSEAKAGGKSPSCGYTFDKQGRYGVTATSYWVATWTGYGQSGTIPFTLSSSRQLEVGEIQVITTKK